MKRLQFKCTLKSDVILNQKAATEGPNQTLDFIPGSCFLGIVASTLYPKYGMNDKTMELFHSGKVRFGDAHPSKGDVRGLKVPACMYYPKLKRPTDELYIHHLVPNLESDEMRQKQLKQCRSGFYTFVNNEATAVKTETNFAIKSAYDKEKRRSQDEQMFGYQSLQKGLEMLFEVEVEVDNDNLVEEIKNALVGNDKRVGRSRTAQYGLVKIESMDNKTIELSTNNRIEIDGKNCITVYADGRLIFLDEFGLPTFRPDAKDLGLDGGEILWCNSQIRTFQYAPWNFTRQCFDTDRCGIEKGSVFVVDVTNCKNLDLKSQYIGSYRNEGFGKVIYNPSFLDADKMGLAKCRVCDNNERKETKEKLPLNTTTLLKFIMQQQNKEKMEQDVYERVNIWVEQYSALFKGDRFASQWGTIRSIAMKHCTISELKYELFDKTSTIHKTKNGQQIEEIKPDAYLTHGVAEEKWNERGRRVKFREFVDGLTDENAQIAIVNLATEMAKKCKEDK